MSGRGGSGRGGNRLPALPKLLDRKIYKTGQTRGADDDEIFQNRVSRTSTVLISFPMWERYFTPEKAARQFTKGFIVLISPDDYFGGLERGCALADKGLQNALVFYETRAQWTAHKPTAPIWQPAQSRLAPLGGNYVARISATTAADDGEKIVRGFHTTSIKGAGIRVYEYADAPTIDECRDQLEALFWLCGDASAVAVANGMDPADATRRKDARLDECKIKGLLDLNKLKQARIINRADRTICPLCLQELSSQGFFSRMEQAEGRAVLDLTITQLNLFHIEELRISGFNHRPYNLGWGHHHCNVVVKDSGIPETLRWMHEVVQHNIKDGHFTPSKSRS